MFWYNFRKSTAMKKFLFFCIATLFFTAVRAQKVDSIYFHLYTDSLKKGVYNYINVDARLKNGHWFPLDNSQIEFSSNAGEWDGNNLIIPANYTGDSVFVTARFKEDEHLSKSITIYIKKGPDNIKVKTEQEVMDELKKNHR